MLRKIVVAAAVVGPAMADNLRQAVQSMLSVAQHHESLMPASNFVTPMDGFYNAKASFAEMQTCGNGVREGTEQCDGGECCKEECTFESVGTTCSMTLKSGFVASGTCLSGDCVSMQEQCAVAVENFGGKTWGAGGSEEEIRADPEPCTDEMAANPCHEIVCKEDGKCRKFAMEASENFMHVEPGTACGDGKICWAGKCTSAAAVDEAIPKGTPQVPAPASAILAQTKTSSEAASAGSRIVEVMVYVDEAGINAGWNADKTKILFEKVNTWYKANSQLDITFVVTHLYQLNRYWGTDSSAILNGFTAFTNTISESFDLAALLSGVDFDGNTAGVAWVGTTCRKSASASINMIFSSMDTTAKILAHELGHNLGMSHDFSDKCSVDEKGYIMGYGSLTTPARFSACSRNAYNAHLSGFTCTLNQPSRDIFGFHNPGSPPAPSPPSPPSPPGPSGCTSTVAMGADCRNAPNCCQSGLTCHSKSQWWAACLPGCVVGMTDSYDNHPWACTVLGSG